MRFFLLLFLRQSILIVTNEHRKRVLDLCRENSFPTDRQGRQTRLLFDGGMNETLKFFIAWDFQNRKRQNNNKQQRDDEDDDENNNNG